MGTTIYPTVPVAQPEAEPWSPLFDDGDEHSIRVDEMFARQVDTEFASGVRDLVHHPEPGLSALKGEAALDAIGEVPPILQELKERTLAQAIDPRQRSLLERMIDTRLGWTNGAIDRLALRATVEVDDQSVADRIAALNQDAAAAWQDPDHLRKLGRTAVNELRYQGERRGWDAAETDAKVRGGLSDLYASAVDAALGQDDLDGAAALYDHARPVLDPERQAAIDRRFVRAREVALYRDVDRDLAGLPPAPSGARPVPGVGHNNPPRPLSPYEQAIENTRRLTQPPPPSAPQPQPDTAGPAASATGDDGARPRQDGETAPVMVKDLTRLSPGEIRMLKKGGFDVHEEKKKGKDAPLDLFKDREGNIFRGRQDGQGEAEPLHDNITNYR